MFLNLKLTVLCFGHYTVPNAALSQNYIGTDDIDIIVQESKPNIWNKFVTSWKCPESLLEVWQATYQKS